MGNRAKMQRVPLNAAWCRKCWTVVVSIHRHDFRSCPCGAIFVDGGFDYVRRGGNPSDFAPARFLIELPASVVGHADSLGGRDVDYKGLGLRRV